MKLDALLALAGLAVLPHSISGQTKRTDGLSVGRGAQLRVARDIADEHCSVEVHRRGCYLTMSWVRISSSFSSRALREAWRSASVWGLTGSTGSDGTGLASAAWVSARRLDLSFSCKASSAATTSGRRTVSLMT